MDTAILINRAKADERLESIVRTAGLAGPFQIVDPDAIERSAADAVAAGARLVVIGGGDGSVSAAAGAVAGTAAALGILPLGTLNHFARDLGIPFDLAQAAALIASGERRRVDVATLNGRTFVNNSAIGLYPLMVVDRDAQQRRLGRSKRLAMLVASLRTLAHFHDERLTLRINDELQERLDTPLLFVGNNDYRLSLPAAGQRSSLADGRLCVLVMRKKGVPGLIAATLRALVHRTRDDDMIRIEEVHRLEVRSTCRQLTVAVDGETWRVDSPLIYAIRPGALTVIAPANPSATDKKKRPGS